MQKLPFLICILVLTSSIPVAIGMYSPQAGIVTNTRTGLTYGSIQAAVTAALSGDTLTVGAGTYDEHIAINKRVTLTGTTGAIVDGGGTGTLFDITGDDVNISKLIIQNGDTGINLDGADRFIMTRCSLINNTDAGIYFTNSDDALIKENNFTASDILMYEDEFCEGNRIYHNNFLRYPAVVTDSFTVWGQTGGTYDMYYGLLNSSDYIRFISAVCSKSEYSNDPDYYQILHTNPMTIHFNITSDAEFLYWDVTYERYVYTDANEESGINYWNDTYPSGGNYWAGHWTFVDDFSGPLQNILGSDGIVDTSKNVGRGGIDYYPFVEPFATFDFPPSVSSPSPDDGTIGINITRATVSISIADVGGTFDWTIEGQYIQSAGAIGAHNGIKTANIITPLPYYIDIVWYVNASNAEKSVHATYTFQTEIFQKYQTNFVNPSYGPSDPQYRKNHWDNIQEAIDTVADDGTVYIYSGTYNVGIGNLNNLWINHPVKLVGENKDTTIIHGEAMHNGWVDFTIEISTVTYPDPTTGFVTGVEISDLTIETEWVPVYQSNCIYFRDVADSVVNNCIIRGDISGGWNGIVINRASKNITISDCQITNLNQANGIDSLGEDILITGNNLSFNYGAIYCDGSERNTISDNIFYRNNIHGVYVIGSDYTNITENDFTLNRLYAVEIRIGSTNSMIYHNNFFDNGLHNPPPFIQAKDDTADSRWNATYPSCGNYWSDLDESSENAFDHYTGPMQNATGPDGIVDFHSPQSYPIDGAGGAQDFYPFIFPYAHIDCQGADFTWTPKYPKPTEHVKFSESACTNEKIVKWTWVFGDGKQSVSTKSSEADHVYMLAGFYTVELTVQDTRGGMYLTSKKIYVGNGPHLFPPEPPKYPKGFTVSEMYMLLRTTDLPKSDAEVTVMVIDSGIIPQKYNNIDLGKITQLGHPSYILSDENGHGTFVNYEVAYLLQTKLPNSKQISYKVFDAEGGTSTDAFLTALTKAKELHPDIVSISAGVIGGSPDDPFAKACEDLRREGIVVIVAAGNFGPTAGSIASPGVSDSVIAVAGSDPQWIDKSNPTLREQKILDLSDDTICSWSSRGPVTGISPKPDVTSPGESIIGPWLRSEKVVSGTSMATPLISGGVALIFAQNKQTIDLVKSLYFWDKSVIPQAFEDAIKASAYEKGDANAWGTGIVQFDKINGNLQMGLYSRLIVWFAFPLILLLIIIILVYYYLRQQRSGSYGKKPFKIPKWAKKL